MSIKKIVIIRHGYTEYNRQDIIQGSGIDADLNETGRKQAALFYEHFKNHPFDKVYTSVLKRSIQSVQAFIDKGIAHEKIADLNEMFWGDMEGLSMVEGESSKIVKNTRKKWTEGDYTATANGGESPIVVQKRVYRALLQIAEKEEETNVLICMHGRALRILLSKLLNIEMRNMDTNIKSDNLALNVITYNAHTKTFEAEILNDTSHLKGFETPWTA